MGHDIEASRPVYDGAIITVRVDSVAMPDGGTVDREVVEHADSVAVVALDDQGRVLLMRQYRHPLGRELIEIPAGLCDVPDEPPADTARRELREEAGLTAQRWTRLAEVHTSPGILTELATLYLAEGITEADREPDGAEEADIELEWVGLGEALQRERDDRGVGEHDPDGDREQHDRGTSHRSILTGRGGAVDRRARPCCRSLRVTAD
jgi:8-oxo-dGTP pyrophosphatase MutT (NUDIX family)